MAGRFVDGGTLTGVDQRPTNKFQPASIPRLRAGDLSHSPCMSSSFKRSCNKSIEHFFRVLFADETGGNAEYISVVVLADKLGNFIAPADAGTDILMFVAVIATPLALPQRRIPKAYSPLSTAAATGWA